MKKIKIIAFGVFLIAIVFASLLASGKLPSIYTRNKEIKVGQDMGIKFNQSLEKLMNYATYNNTTVKGTEIVKAENLFFKDGVTISVKTLLDTDYKKYTNDKPYAIKDSQNVSFINDNGNFASTIVKDQKGVPAEIKFEEIK